MYRIRKGKVVGGLAHRRRRRARLHLARQPDPRLAARALLQPLAARRHARDRRLRIRRLGAARSGSCSARATTSPRTSRSAPSRRSWSGRSIVNPTLKMPALTAFTAGGGPIVPGKVFPFVFITIMCGAISGFHSLVSSGTTPKMLSRESHARPIGYGAMLIESLVGVVALIAATSLPPGDYFAINIDLAQAGPLDAGPREDGLHASQNLRAYEAAVRGGAAGALGRRRLAGRRHGADLLRDPALPVAGLLLVPLRDHVRGALHPHDDRHRAPAWRASSCRRSRGGSTRSSGGPTGCPGTIVSTGLVVLGLGLLHLDRIDRHDLADVRNLEPAPGRGGAGGRGHGPGQRGAGAVPLGDARCPMLWVTARRLTAGYQLVVRPIPADGPDRDRSGDRLQGKPERLADDRHGGLRRGDPRRHGSALDPGPPGDGDADSRHAARAPRDPPAARSVLLGEDAIAVAGGDPFPVRVAGGWAAARALDRQRAGRLPTEKAEPGIRLAITLGKVEERIQAWLSRERRATRSRSIRTASMDRRRHSGAGKNLLMSRAAAAGIVPGRSEL